MHRVGAEEVELSQTAWLAAVRDVAAAVPFADNCSKCNTGTFPSRGEVEVKSGADAGSLQATSWCPTCERGWTCGWSTDAPNWI